MDLAQVVAHARVGADHEDRGNKAVVDDGALLINGVREQLSVRAAEAEHPAQG